MDSMKKNKKKDKKKDKKKHRKRRNSGHADFELDDFIGPSLSLAQSKDSSPPPKILKPISKEEWQIEQSKTRRVYDPDTGRNRLVKGDGEIIEEIVSYKQQQSINKMATKNDAVTYEKTATAMTKLD